MSDLRMPPTKEATDAAIADLLRLPSWANAAHFTPLLGEPAGLYYVIVFDPAQRLASGSTACADPGTVPIAATAGETAVLGVFCQANESLSAAFGVGPAVRGVDDPGLRELLARVTGRVFAYSFPAREGSVF